MTSPTTGKTLVEQLENLAEFLVRVRGLDADGVILREAASALERLEAEKQAAERERDEARRGLESLTPGGSEYVADVPACVAYIRRARESQHDAIVKAVSARKADESALTAALQREASMRERAAECCFSTAVYETRPEHQETRDRTRRAIHEAIRALPLEPKS